MNNLFDFIAKHFHWLIFLFLEIVSGVMLFSYNNYQGSVWMSTSNAVTGKMLEWRAGVEQFFSLRRTNQLLTERNLVLEQQLRIYREQIAKDKTATDHQTLTADSSATLAILFDTAIPAQVVNNSVNKPNNLITIDKGRDDGVKIDMGVVSGSGLVGVVYMVADHYSIVLPVLNKRSRVSCSIRNRNYFGYLTWEGGKANEAYVEDVPRHAKFRKGEWVETSGYSAIFPPGIAVGRITGIYNSSDGLSYRLKVHLSTDFACLRDVFVVSGKGFYEQRMLNDAVADSLEIDKGKE